MAATTEQMEEVYERIRNELMLQYDTKMEDQKNEMKEYNEKIEEQKKEMAALHEKWLTKALRQIKKYFRLRNGDG